MTNTTKVLDSVLQRDVSRKEFLQYTGVALLSIVGITSMMHHIRGFGQTTSSSQPQTQKRTSGYGMSAYGR